MSNAKGSILGLLFIAALAGVGAEDNSTDAYSSIRGGKALSVFQVVKFPNSVCSGTSSYNGTCYTSTECSTKGGSSAGSCASGFGVCCVFTLGCGGSSSQNCTYFLSTTTQPAGHCGAKICKCSSDICQLRIDFSTFVITGPDTATVLTSFEINGVLAGASGKSTRTATQCLTDKFTISNGGASSPPIICGTNTGQHVYVDASDSCNLLNFELGQTGVGTTIPTRQWNLKVTQISCYDVNLAPSGCTQYFYGSTTGTIQTFNYANTYHLANQKEQFCFRRERNYCKICYSAAIATDFGISATLAKGYKAATKCCGYGTVGTKTTVGFDCVMIPGASTTPNKAAANNSLCGRSAGLVTATASTTGATVCSMVTPFMISFVTDGFEFTIDGTKGFKLTYWETTC